MIYQTQNQGDTASFTCQATGEPVPTISWYFNGTTVNEAEILKYTISVISLNSTTISKMLTIMSVESSDAGTYMCNATNVIFTDTISGVLTVNGELYYPFINEKPIFRLLRKPYNIAHRKNNPSLY